MTEAEHDTVAALLMKAKLETAGKLHVGQGTAAAYDGGWTFCIVCGRPTTCAWACDYGAGEPCWNNVADRCDSSNRPARFRVTPAENVLLAEYLME